MCQIGNFDLSLLICYPCSSGSQTYRHCLNQFPQNSFIFHSLSVYVVLHHMQKPHMYQSERTGQGLFAEMQAEMASVTQLLLAAHMVCRVPASWAALRSPLTYEQV